MRLVLNCLKNFLLRNLFKCGECGFSITAERKYKLIKSTGEQREYTYYHCTGRSKRVRCKQMHLHVTEEKLIEQIKDLLNSVTIHPDFYKLAIEALAQEEYKEAEEHQSLASHNSKLIEKQKQAINNLRRMRYMGEVDDDDWYKEEMGALKAKLESLESGSKHAEYKRRNWRELAKENFTFARYAKEQFETDIEENKRTVINKLGDMLTILDRTIHLTPNKYLVPIMKMNESQSRLSEMVRTDSQQGGIGSKPDQSLVWLRIPVKNPTTEVWGQKCDIIKGVSQ